MSKNKPGTKRVCPRVPVELYWRMSAARARSRQTLEQFMLDAIEAAVGRSEAETWK